ncbi:TIGR00730 family Rossman fold protein, partial [Arthrospira platensis SPKY1]|nr:TIGR00730 family Rossman fold protein [Arthrospira platensis SPKY1]
MAERKELMVEISDAFIALPGGFGTLDELAEILTLNQLRIIDKPLGLLNTNGYFNPLLQFLDIGVKEGFVRAEHKNNILVSEDVEELLTMLHVYQP